MEDLQYNRIREVLVSRGIKQTELLNPESKDELKKAWKTIKEKS